MKKPKSHKYTHLYRDSRGKWRRQFRHKDVAKKIPLPLDLENRGGREAYDACMRQIETPTAPAPLKTGSLALLIKLYKSSPEFTTKAASTRRQYDLFLTELSDKFGDLPVASMPRAWIIQMRDLRADKPRTANYMLSIISLLMTYAL